MGQYSEEKRQMMQAVGLGDSNGKSRSNEMKRYEDRLITMESVSRHVTCVNVTIIWILCLVQPSDATKAMSL